MNVTAWLGEPIVLIKFLWFFRNLFQIYVRIQEDAEFNVIPDCELNKTFTIQENTLPGNIEGNKGFIITCNEEDLKALMKNLTTISSQSDRILLLTVNFSQKLLNSYTKAVITNNLTNTILYVKELNQVVVYNKFKKLLKYFDSEEHEIIEEFLNDKNYYSYPISSTLFETLPTSFTRNGKRLGVDYVTLKTVAKAFNFSITYYVPPGTDWFGTKYTNGTITGCLGELYSGNSQIAFNQMFIKDYNISELEMSNVIFSDRLCVVVGKSNSYPLLPEIQSDIVYATLFVIICCVVTLKLIRKFNNLKCKKKQFDDGFFGVLTHIFQMVLSASRHQIISSNLYERIFIGTFLFYGLINTTILQSLLSMAATKPLVSSQIDSLHDLANSNYKIITSSNNLQNVFHGSSMPHMTTLNNRLIVTHYTKPDYEQFGYLIREAKYKYQQKLENSRKGFVNNHLVKECPDNYLLAYMYRKNFFFKPKLNNFLMKLFEYGFLQKWHNDVMSNTYSTDFNYTTVNTRFVNSKKKISIFQFPLFPLVVGNLLGVSVFLLEVVIFQINRCLKK